MSSLPLAAFLSEIDSLIDQKTISVEQVLDGRSEYIKVQLHTESSRVGPLVTLVASKGAKETLSEGAYRLILSHAPSPENLSKNKAISPSVVKMVSRMRGLS